jgi:hypothetical protein
VVLGGMYRVEPPPEYFSPKWDPKDDHIMSKIGVALIDRVGASSTSPSPRQWAPLDGYSSTGESAWTRVDEQTKNQIKNYEKRENYVFGRAHGVNAYYHIETQEAHTNLLQRVRKRIQKLESGSAMEQSCCGPSDGKYIQRLDTELRLLVGAQNVLNDRVGFTHPFSISVREEHVEEVWHTKQMVGLNGTEYGR